MILILRNVSVAIFSPLQFPSSIYICVSFGIARILSRMTDGVLGPSIRGDVRCLLLKKRIIYSPLFITKFAIYFEVFRIFFWGIKISLLLSDIIMMMMMRCDADDRHQDNGGGWGFFGDHHATNLMDTFLYSLASPSFLDCETAAWATTTHHEYGG